MANVYVYSGAVGAGDGSDWANAYTTLDAAATAKAAGDVFYVAHDHVQTQGSALIVTFAGTLAAPNKIFCVDRGGGVPPVTADLRTTATVETTGAFGISLRGTFYMYGVGFLTGSGAVVANLSIGNTSAAMQLLEACSLFLNGTSSSRLLVPSSLSSNKVVLLNCFYKFSGLQNVCGQSGGTLRIQGGSIVSGSSNVTSLFSWTLSGGVTFDVIVDGLDLSNLGATVNLSSGGASAQAGQLVFRNCKMPASWSGSVIAAAFTTPGSRVSAYNCDSTDTNYQLWVAEYAGSIRQETTIVRTGGASDGVTPYSWKMASLAAAAFPIHILRSPEIFLWNDYVGSAKTFNVEIVHDSLTALNDNEVWIEVQYLGTSGFPLGAFINDGIADKLPSTTAAAQATSTKAWTTTGITNVNKQVLSVTFTPQEKGPYIATVCLAKASTTIYVDPKVHMTDSLPLVDTVRMIPGYGYAANMPGGGSRARLPAGLSGMG